MRIQANMRTHADVQTEGQMHTVAHTKLIHTELCIHRAHLARVDKHIFQAHKQMHIRKGLCMPMYMH